MKSKPSYFLWLKKHQEKMTIEKTNKSILRSDIWEEILTSYFYVTESDRINLNFRSIWLVNLYAQVFKFNVNLITLEAKKYVSE